MSNTNKSKIEETLLNFKRNVIEFVTSLEKQNYELSNAAPEYLSDIDDFLYEVCSFIDDELDLIKEENDGIERDFTIST